MPERRKQWRRECAQSVTHRRRVEAPWPIPAACATDCKKKAGGSRYGPRELGSEVDRSQLLKTAFPLGRLP